MNVKVGTEHIAAHLDFYKIQHFMQGESEEENLLQVINQKVSSIYRVVRNDPDYDPKFFKQTPSKMEEFFHIQSHLNDLTKNIRLQNQREESVTEDEF